MAFSSNREQLAVFVTDSGCVVLCYLCSEKCCTAIETFVASNEAAQNESLPPSVVQLPSHCGE